MSNSTIVNPFEFLSSKLDEVLKATAAKSLKRVLTTEDVQKEYAISIERQQHFRSRDGMPYYRIGRVVMYERKELETWITKFDHKVQ